MLSKINITGTLLWNYASAVEEKCLRWLVLQVSREAPLVLLVITLIQVINNKNI